LGSGIFISSAERSQGKKRSAQKPPHLVGPSERGEKRERLGPGYQRELWRRQSYGYARKKRSQGNQTERQSSSFSNVMHRPSTEGNERCRQRMRRCRISNTTQSILCEICEYGGLGLLTLTGAQHIYKQKATITLASLVSTVQYSVCMCVCKMRHRMCVWRIYTPTSDQPRTQFMTQLRTFCLQAEKTASKI
jgi:hypothetical protein